MIVDIHYHWWKLASDEETARRTVAGLLEDAARNGVHRTVDEVLPLLKDYMDDLNCDKLVRRMNSSGIDTSIILMMDNVNLGVSSERIMQANELCAAAANRHPGRIVAFAGIDPRRPGAPDMLRRCFTDFGMKGLKWHPDNGYYPNSKEAYAVLEVLNEFGYPLLTHCGLLARSRAKYTHPIHLDDIALDFPEMPIIAAHMGHGWWRDWLAVAQYKSNIYGDLSMWQLTAWSKPHLFRKYLREMLDVVGPGRILFATDGPVYEPLITNGDWIRFLLDLPLQREDGLTFSQSEINGILGNDAATLLKISKKEM